MFARLFVCTRRTATARLPRLAANTKYDKTTGIPSPTYDADVGLVLAWSLTTCDRRVGH